jgi:hypothetical protein
MRAMKCALLILCMLAGPVVAGEPIALFNGKDFGGWKFEVDSGEPEAVWSVKDGIITCKGKPRGVMRTEKEFGDYEVVVEWRWPKGGKPGNNGLLIHCSKPKVMGPWPQSLEVQLMNGNAGDFWMIKEKIEGSGENKGRRWINSTDDSEKPIGEWKEMKGRAEGDKVTVWVNGTKVNEGKSCSATKGALCLQSEGAEIQFRKVELTPLK